MERARGWGLVATGIVAIVVGAVLLVTPMGTHHSGNCGSVVAPRHPTLNNDDTLQEQVLADQDCPAERRFRGVVAVVVIAGGVAVTALGSTRPRRETAVAVTSDGGASGTNVA
ncbi:MAG TPA: hypothetical protein VFA83_07725 [Acidimicrobiales bacterium]|nr:hypothetical protein [Acidimicrobiales bacterium]